MRLRSGWSRRHLSRMFKDTVGVTISACRRVQRGERVRNALRRGVPVTNAAFDAGYGSMRAFYDSAGSQMGVTPSAFGDGASGACVRYTLFSSPLGEILVAATDRGVCAVRIGDSREALEAELTAEFAQARVERGDENLERVASIVRDLAGGRPAASAAASAAARASSASACAAAASALASSAAACASASATSASDWAACAALIAAAAVPPSGSYGRSVSPQRPRSAEGRE